MNHFNLLLASILITCSSCSEHYQKTNTGIHSSIGEKEIRLNPDESNVINLSDIAKKIDIKVLETNGDNLIGDILKIDFDDGYFIQNSVDKLVYVFDLSGQFKNKIGQIGNGPGDLLFPECFALNKEEKEIWLSSNFQSIYKYDYAGNFRNRFSLDIKFKDFHIKDKDMIYFHTSKFYNFSKGNEPVNYNLWIMNKENGIETFFPYNPSIYSNGSLYFDSKIPFNTVDGKITYNYIFCDTIYSIEYPEDIKPVYIIDFGAKKVAQNLNNITGEEALEYFKNNTEKACYVQNFIETKGFLRFNYLMNSQLYDVFYDKGNNTLVEGILVNDVLGGRIEFKTHSNNKLVGYINAFDIKIEDRAYDFLDQKVIDRLNNLKEEDNPILIEIELNDIMK